MADELDDEDKSRTCDICDKTFSNAEVLNDHRPQHYKFQQEKRYDRGDKGHSLSGPNAKDDLQSYNDPLNLGVLECPPTQKLTDFQSPASSDKTNLSSPTTTEFTKSKLSPPESELDSNDEIMKDEQNLRNTEEKSGTKVDNVKDEALWDILEVKMEPEEENVEEYSGGVIPKQKYNKLKKFEGKLFRF